MLDIMKDNPYASKYENMKYNRSGRSGIMLPVLSLGLWHNFGGVDDLENAKSLIQFAFDKGITHFDLANNYGPPPGSAEENFGEILKNHLADYRDEMIISTKAGYKMWEGPYGDWGSRKYLISSLDQSLKRLQLEYVDIFYSHRPDPNTPIEETMMALDHVVRQGKALYIGLSNYNVDETTRAVRILKELGTPCLIHQPRYSMFDRWVEDGLLDLLEQEGIGCIPFSPLAQGLLTNRYLEGIPQNSRVAKPWGFLQENQLTREVLSTIKALNEIASQRGQSLAQMALSWILKDHRISSVLVGVSSIKQLSDNLEILQSSAFNDSELNEIELLLEAFE